jgi:hypothetical protein
MIFKTILGVLYEIYMKVLCLSVSEIVLTPKYLERFHNFNLTSVGFH